MRPHRRQPTSLPRPWDSPSKTTGVGCHFLLQCMKVKSESEVTQSCPTLSNPMDCSLPGSSVQWDFLGKSTRVGCHCLLLFHPSYSIPSLEVCDLILSCSFCDSHTEIKQKPANFFLNSQILNILGLYTTNSVS